MIMEAKQVNIPEYTLLAQSMHQEILQTYREIQTKYPLPVVQTFSYAKRLQALRNLETHLKETVQQSI